MITRIIGECKLITYTNIIGNAADVALAEQLHTLEHAQKIDYLTLSSDDIQRKRLKAISSNGIQCGITLPRDQNLYSGAILQLTDQYALVVRSANLSWLRCVPKDSAAALELGYFAGNMHWPVRFDGGNLDIELKGKVSDYEERLMHFINAGRITLENTHG